MKPIWHVFFGLVFVTPVTIFSHLTLLPAVLIFFSSFLIDFDHYVWYVQRTGKYSIQRAYKYFPNIKIKKGQKFMLLFHTLEFHIFVGLLTFIWSGFIYVLIGMIFHSFTDILTIKNYEREYSLLDYLFSDKKNYV